MRSQRRVAAAEPQRDGLVLLFLAAIEPGTRHVGHEPPTDGVLVARRVAVHGWLERQVRLGGRGRGDRGGRLAGARDSPDEVPQ